jgi:hypothetical protein
MGPATRRKLVEMVETASSCGPSPIVPLTSTNFPPPSTIPLTPSPMDETADSPSKEELEELELEDPIDLGAMDESL